MGLLLNLVGGAFSIVLALILGIVGFIGWILTSIGYSIYLKKVSYGSVWMAFIPVLRDLAIMDCLSRTQTHSLVTVAGIDVSLYKLKYIFIGQVILDIALSKSVIWISAVLMIIKILILIIEYTTAFSYIEGCRSEDKQFIGCVAGIFPLVAVVKFYLYSGLQGIPGQSSNIN